MQVKVRFRFNKVTGEVEEFLVEQDSTLASTEHDRQHDHLAADIGRILALDPRVAEVQGGMSLARKPIERQEDQSEETELQKPRETQKS